MYTGFGLRVEIAHQLASQNTSQVCTNLVLRVEIANQLSSQNSSQVDSVNLTHILQGSHILPTA